MKIGLLAISLLMTLGCAEARLYDAPQVGVYNITVVFVDSADEVTELCKRNDAIACAYPNESPCIIIYNRHTWERYSTHEDAHCFGINKHEGI